MGVSPHPLECQKGVGHVGLSRLEFSSRHRENDLLRSTYFKITPLVSAADPRRQARVCVASETDLW